MPPWKVFLWSSWRLILAALTVLFIYQFGWAISFGRSYARHHEPACKTDHVSHAKRSFWTLSVIVIVVLLGEGIFGRESTTLFAAVHETISAVFLVFLGLVIWLWNGNKIPDAHWILGYICAFLGGITAATGLIRIYLLHANHAP